MAVRVDLQNPAKLDGVPARKRLQNWVEAALQQDYRELEQSIRVVDDAESRELNTRYRGKHSPTNVLSFPADDEWLEYACLGDLVICAPLVAREAGDQGKSLDAHWAHLVVHGMLHLQGYDHQTGAEAASMEALEIKILHTLGYTNPYND